MKKNKIYIKNKKSLFSLFIALFLALNFTFAQVNDIEVIVTNIIEDLGGTVHNGNIRIEKGYQGTLVIDVFPPNSNCEVGTITLGPGVGAHNCAVFFEPIFCAGVWCFVFSNPADPSCEIKHCVNVAVCKEVKVSKGFFQWIELECESIVSPPNDILGENLVSNSANSLARSDQQDKEVSSEEKELSITVNKVFPNPFNGEFTLDLESTKKDKIAIEVIDILGKSVFLQTSEVEVGKNAINVALDSKVSGGNYFLKVSDSLGNTYSKKIIYIKQ